MSTYSVRQAWDLIGFGGNLNTVPVGGAWGPDQPAEVRILGGRTLYEAVDNCGGEKVRLARLVVGTNGLRQINRYVDADTLLEVVSS